ncbi:MAG: CHASE2 domain-containing protein [Xenococcaceae cyanobacterium]
MESFFKRWSGFFVLTPIVFLLLSGVRLLGKLQPEEFKAYDWLFKSRPAESADARIVIVGITEADIQKQKTYPFPDIIYGELLKKIKAQNPRAIGFDIVRDQPVEPGHAQLVEVYQTTPNLIGIGKFTGTQIAPPPQLQELGQVADSSGIVDEDGVVRRAYLYPPSKVPIRTFALELALRYLAAEGIKLEESSDGRWLQLGQARFHRFGCNDGSYVRANDRGFQILVNWRGDGGHFRHVEVTEVLSDKIPPDLFRERIVLIGSYAPSLKNAYYTPYSKWEGGIPQRMYAVEIHANLVSQIISAALDGRSSMKVWADLLDYVWLFGWVGVTVGCVWRVRKIENPVILLSIVGVEGIGLTGLLTGITYWFFLNSWWIPSVPALIGIWLGLIFVVVYVVIWQRLQEKQKYIETLKVEVRARTEELKAAQEQLMAQERLAFLGRLTAGLNHEMKNILFGIARGAEASGMLLSDLREVCQETLLGDEEMGELSEILDYLEENLKGIESLIKRGRDFRERFSPVNFKDFSQKSPLVPSNINQLILDCFKLVSTNKRGEDSIKGLEVRENYDESLEAIEVVPQEVTFVLIGLIDNAWDAVLEKQKQQGENYIPKILLTTRNLGDEVEIIVQDNGIGVSPELESEIFKSFVTTKPPGKGTGLGLSLASDIIVARYQGSIRWETIETEGEKQTQFVVKFSQAR